MKKIVILLFSFFCSMPISSNGYLVEYDVYIEDAMVNECGTYFYKGVTKGINDTLLVFSEKKQRIRKHRIATLRLQAYPVYYNLNVKVDSCYMWNINEPYLLLKLHKVIKHRLKK